MLLPKCPTEPWFHLWYRVSHNHLGSGESFAPPPPPPAIGEDTWCRRWGGGGWGQIATSGGSSLYQLRSYQHTEKKIWKKNYAAWIALEPWLNACACMPLTRVFQVALRRGGWFPHGEEWEALVKEFNLYGGGNLKRSHFDHMNLFKAKTNILQILNVN